MAVFLGVFAAFLTAFYMTRQMFYVFFGNCRLALSKTTASEQLRSSMRISAKEHPRDELPPGPHESPWVMLAPLVILAGFTVLLGFIGTPAWPWIQSFLDGEPATFNLGRFSGDVLLIMVLSSLVAFAGIGLAYWLYGRKPIPGLETPDVLERVRPDSVLVA